MKKVHINDDVWNIKVGKRFVEMRLEGSKLKYCPSIHQIAELLNLVKHYDKEFSCDCCSGPEIRITPMDMTYYLHRIHYEADIDEYLEQRAQMPLPREV